MLLFLKFIFQLSSIPELDNISVSAEAPSSSSEPALNGEASAPPNNVSASSNISPADVTQPAVAEVVRNMF